MTTKRFVALLFIVLLLTIIGVSIAENKVACERGIKGRHSMLAIRRGFEVSAHARFARANQQGNKDIAKVQREEGASMYALAHEITVSPPDCSGVYPLNK